MNSPTKCLEENLFPFPTSEISHASCNPLERTCLSSAVEQAKSSSQLLASASSLQAQTTETLESETQLDAFLKEIYKEVMCPSKALAVPSRGKSMKRLRQLVEQKPARQNASTKRKRTRVCKAIVAKAPPSSIIQAETTSSTSTSSTGTSSTASKEPNSAFASLRSISNSSNPAGSYEQVLSYLNFLFDEQVQPNLPSKNEPSPRLQANNRIRTLVYKHHLHLEANAYLLEHWKTEAYSLSDLAETCTEILRRSDLLDYFHS